MSVYISPAGIRSTLLGVRVKTGTFNTPNGEQSLFTVAGGRIAMTSIVGEVTTAFGAVASNTKLVYDITAAGPADVDLCAVADTASAAVGTLFTITGTPATAMQITAGGVAPSSVVLANPIIMLPGVIHWNAAADPGNGALHFTMTYVPLDDEATVTAAV